MKTSEIIDGVVIRPSLLSKEKLTTYNSTDGLVDYYAEGTVDWNKTLWLKDNYNTAVTGRYDTKTYTPKFGGEFNMLANKDGSVKIGKYWITRVIHNNPATIVFWNDGTKTVAKVQEGDEYNPIAGLLTCVMKKMIGNEHTQQLLEDWGTCYSTQFSPCCGLDYIPNDISLKDVRKKHRSK